MIKKILKWIAAVIVVMLLVLYIPEYFHICQDCGEFFVGVGYSPNIVADLVNEGEQTICKQCAQEHHMVAIALGKSVNDFKHPAFKDPLTLLKDRF